MRSSKKAGKCRHDRSVRYPHLDRIDDPFIGLGSQHLSECILCREHILDEATSALDNTTEMLIQKSLKELAKGRTCLIVAHRLSTIKNADEIAVVSKGKIMEKGTHDELMKLNGIYSDLYRLQFKNSDEEFTANIDIN